MQGIDALADLVSCTLGPRGQSVMLANAGAPHVTRDGVEAATALELSDRLANLGAELVRSVVAETSSQVGDGTATAILMARAMARRAVRLLAAGLEPRELRSGLDEAAEAVLSQLRAESRAVAAHEIARIAELSAGEPEAGELLSQALNSVGADGLVEVETAHGTETRLSIEPGCRFARGYISPYFVSDEVRAECVLENARIVLSHTPIAELAPLLPLLEASLREDVPLLIVAEDVLGDALSGLVVNRLKSKLRCVAVRAPSFGVERREHLRDLAALTGGHVLGDHSAATLRETGLSSLGTVRKVVVTAEHTTLIGAAGNPALVRARLSEVKHLLNRAQNDPAQSDSQRKSLSARARMLANGAAVIAVGGHSEAEIQNRKDCFEDALAAARAALTGGIVLGGGVSLLRCENAIQRLTDTNGARLAGRSIAQAALSEPLRHLARNAGCDGDAVVAHVRASARNLGFDVLTRCYCDFEAARIWDPCEVVAQSFTSAVRLASLLLTSGACLVSNEAPLDDYADV